MGPEPASFAQGEPSLRFGLLPAAVTPRWLIGLGALAALVCLVHATAWPLFAGRDAQTYLMYYLEMGAADPVFPQLMLFRTPGAPLVLGLSLDLGGHLFLEFLLGACYVLSILAVFAAGSFWDRRIGLVAALALMAYPGYGALCHSISADGLFAFGMAFWTLLICATAARPTLWKFALHGLAVFLLTMVRPAAVVFVLVFALLPLILSAPARVRAYRTWAFAATATALLLGWAAYNELRYDDFTISRMSAGQVPLYRVLAVDRLLDPDNGPESRELAAAIESDLLTREPYRSYGVTLNEFLHTGRIAMWTDLAGLSDRMWGWDSDYAKLRGAAREAILKHPLDFAGGVADTVWEEMTDARSKTPAPQSPPPRRTIECELSCVDEEGRTIEVAGRRLPAPWDHAEPIPRGHHYWLQSTPDDSIKSDWSSLTNPRFRFEDPRIEARYERLSHDLAQLMAKLPSRDGSFAWAGRFNNSIEPRLPPMLFWLLVGAVGLAIAPLPHTRVLLFLCFLALAGVVSAALAAPSAPWYRLPFDPLFILFGCAGALSGGLALAARGRAALRRRRA
jgi:hypothetical protein